MIIIYFSFIILRYTPILLSFLAPSPQYERPITGDNNEPPRLRLDLLQRARFVKTLPDWQRPRLVHDLPVELTPYSCRSKRHDAASISLHSPLLPTTGFPSGHGTTRRAFSSSQDCGEGMGVPTWNIGPASVMRASTPYFRQVVIAADSGDLRATASSRSREACPPSFSFLSAIGFRFSLD